MTASDSRVVPSLPEAFSFDGQRISFNVPPGLLPEAVDRLLPAISLDQKAELQAGLDRIDLQAMEDLFDTGHPSRALLAAVLGLACDAIGRRADALYWLERASGIEPHFHVLSVLAERHLQAGHVTRSAEFAERMMAVNPDWRFQYHCALALIRCGRYGRARALLRDLIDRDQGGSIVHSTYVVSFSNLPQHELRAVHQEWADRFAPKRLARTSHSNHPDPDRPLRVGYLSANFFTSSCTHFFEPILETADRSQVRVFGYGSDENSQYAIAERVIPKFDVFRDIRDLDDQAVVQRIEEDHIDILVAYYGYTPGHRLGVMAYKPAPVQVNLGYITTLGIQQVEYRISDRTFDPPGSASHYLEETLYLPGGFICYRPPAQYPSICRSPALDKGHFTFGSFHNFAKLNSDLISLWAQVLLGCPTARMSLKCYDAGNDPEIREWVSAEFETHGVARDRLDIRGQVSSLEHLLLLNEIDVILDTYPYNGMVTSMEALWMGVPVVTLYGQKWVERAGLSLLTHLGLESFAAATPEQYVAKTIALTSNLEALDKIRASMRHRMVSSPLCDFQRLGRELQAAYRQMWRNWCQSQ